MIVRERSAKPKERVKEMSRIEMTFLLSFLLLSGLVTKTSSNHYELFHTDKLLLYYQVSCSTCYQELRLKQCHWKACQIYLPNSELWFTWCCPSHCCSLLSWWVAISWDQSRVMGFQIHHTMLQSISKMGWKERAWIMTTFLNNQSWHLWQPLPQHIIILHACNTK